MLVKTIGIKTTGVKNYEKLKRYKKKTMGSTFGGQNSFYEFSCNEHS